MTKGGHRTVPVKYRLAGKKGEERHTAHKRHSRVPSTPKPPHSFGMLCPQRV